MSMSPRLLRPRATGFTPKSIAGLAAWFDADDFSTITLNSNTVSEWRDKSGNGRHATQATASNQPAYATNTLNGRPVLTTTTLSGQGMAVSGWTYSNNSTAMFVFRATNLNQAIHQRGSINAEGSALVQNPGSGFVLRARKASVDSDISYTQNAFGIGAALITPTSVTSYLNGAYGSAISSTTTYSGTVALRLFSLSATLYSGSSIAEWLWYDAALSTSQVTSLARYLSKKWNITLS